MSSTSFSIALEENPDASDLEAIRHGLVTFNHSRAGDDSYKSLTLLLRNAMNTVVGGLMGSSYWGWLYVDMLWVKEEFRQQGCGHKLLATAEDEAVRRGCHSAYLDTFSFQALRFYQKRGYTVFGELPDFPVDCQRYFLYKRLD
ncbi:MAG: GNAT family N-acetyltransferase [Chroococcidiopsidaceae cyanobacterium CP_BM_ER_R8_30]|nr:GNAT family N-acetyltransferase [Chroococcidiopsidaceae cyanobacterium CP_BM_ER_R8_30]